MTGRFVAVSRDMTIIQGDCTQVLQSPWLSPGSVKAVVTSPPYANQRKNHYGGISEDDYPDWTVSWMREIKPLLDPLGSVMIVISEHVQNGVLSPYVLRTQLALHADGWFWAGTDRATDLL